MGSADAKRIAAWAVAAAACIAAAIWGDVRLQLLASAGLVLVALRALALGRQQLLDRLPGWLRESIGPILLIGLSGVLYRRLLIGDFPVNHDHAVMLLRAWVTGTELIPAGQLTGFSLYQFAGHPANALYPMGTDLLVVAFKAATLGLASWETAYCWALFVAVVAYPTALYALGHRLGGVPAGLAAGVLGLIDRGHWFQAGWDFNLNWGVWSMGLSFSLCLWCLWAFERLARRPGRRWLWLGAAASLAGAVICHPMAVALLGIALPLLLLVMGLRHRLPAPGRWMPRTASAVLVGGLLCAWWLVPFVARSAWYEPLASLYRPYRDVIHGLLDGRLLADLAPLLAIAGLIGLAWAARERRPLALMMLIAVGWLLYFSSDTFLLDFDVLKRLPVVGQLQTERFTYLIRAFLLLGAAWLAARLCRPTAADSGAPPDRARWWRLLLPALAAAPLLVYGWQAGPFPWFAPAAPLDWSSDSELYTELQAAAEAVRALPEDEVGRIALFAPEHQHLLLLLPVWTGRPVFKVGFTPENNYRYKFSSRDPAVLRAIGITHALALGMKPGPEFETLQRFGRLGLYRFRRPNRRPFALQGPGRAELLAAERESMRFALHGTGPASRLIVYRGHYAAWQATIEGRPVPIQGAGVGDSPAGFMSIPVRDGRLHLSWRVGAAEWLGNAATWLGLAICLLVAAAGHLARWRRWPAARLRRWSMIAGDGLTLAALAALVGGGAGLLLQLLFASADPFADREVIADVRDHLSEARAAVIRTDQRQACAPWDGERLRCPGPEWNYVGETVIIADHQLRQCIWLHPIRAARHAVTFSDVPLGDALEGFMALDDRVVEPPGPHGVELRVLIDGAEVGRFSCPARRGWHPWRVATPGRRSEHGRITFESSARFTGRRHFCFTAYTTVADDAL